MLIKTHSTPTSECATDESTGLFILLVPLSIVVLITLGQMVKD